MVSFKNGVESKKDYRHFNVKTVSGIDDFATMKEVVHRRYKRLLDEGQPLPQLVIIDGGKGQLSAAMESIEAWHAENLRVPVSARCGAVALGLDCADRISRWENGLNMPSVANLFKLAGIYKVTPQELYPELMETRD